MSDKFLPIWKMVRANLLNRENIWLELLVLKLDQPLTLHVAHKTYLLTLNATYNDKASLQTKNLVGAQQQVNWSD
jgi:hypothetical protein